MHDNSNQLSATKGGGRGIYECLAGDFPAAALGQDVRTSEGGDRLEQMFDVVS
jgi:hypothetical protein